MIRAELESFRESADPLAHGIRAWLAGSDSVRAEAAGILVASTVRALHALLTQG